MNDTQRQKQEELEAYKQRKQEALDAENGKRPLHQYEVIPSISWVRVGKGVFDTALGGYIHGELCITIQRLGLKEYIISCSGQIAVEKTELTAKRKGRGMLQAAVDLKKKPAEILTENPN